MTWTRVARAADLTGDGPHAVSAGAVDLVALRTGGALRVYEGRCPHQGALLGEGELDGGALVCRNHRWRFDAATGKRDGGPECLRACPVEVRGPHLDEVWVDASGLTAAKTQAARRRIAELPGPRPLPIVGNGLQLDVDTLHLGLEKWARQYGPIYRIMAGRIPYLCVSDPQVSEQVLRARPETFRRDNRVEPVFKELGVSGVFSAEGAAWRSQRRLAMEALSPRHLRASYASLMRAAERLCGRWQRSAGQTLDLQAELMRFTVDVTTALVFGRDLNTIEGGDDVIQRDLEHVMPAFARRLNAVVPYWRWVRLPRDRRVDAAVARLRVWLGELVTTARVRLDAGAAPANFLESMLVARDSDGQPFSDEVIFGNCMTMLLAGEDTTANSLAFAVHLLCDHPDEAAALRAEADAVLGGARVPDLDQTQRLARALAVANEAMRLLPVAPVNFMNAIHDTVLGDVEVPAGTGVIVMSRIPATDARYFADPQVFRPARWLDGGAGGAHEAAASQPFGSGPRICPGRSLALVEMKLVLATLYRNFDVARVGASSEVGERYSFVVMPTGVRVRLQPRAAS